MSIAAAEVRKLIKIVRQYEVIYGGGISSGDAAVREDCEDLVAALEAELGTARRAPKDTEEARPKSSRTTAIAELGGRRAEAAKDKRGALKGGSRPADVSKDKRTPETKAAPAKGAKSAPPAKGAKSAPSPAKAAAPAKTAARSKAAPAKTAKASARSKAATAKAASKESVDIRSKHKGAAKAAIDRADKLTVRQSGDAAPDAKRRFAALHLFDAFAQNRLPKYGGYIVCVRFSEETGYTVVEIIGYENLQDIYPEGDSLVFKSVGCKLYAIVEPTNYLLKSVEPVNRPSDQMVPYRFAELTAITTKRFQTILIGRKPVFMPTSFSVYKPSGEDLAVLFYDTAEVYANIQDFTIMILRDRLGVPAPDSRKAAEALARGARDFRLWIDEA